MAALVGAIASSLGLEAGLVSLGFAGTAWLLTWLARNEWSSKKKQARAAAIGSALVTASFICVIAIPPARESVFFIASPRFEIRPESSALVPRHGETKVAVFVDGEEAGADYSCSWEPSEYIVPAGPACATSVRQPPDLLPPDLVSHRQFTVSVGVRKGNNDYPSASILLTATPAAEIRIMFEPRGALRRIYAGDDVRAWALLDGQPPPAGFTCKWEGEDELSADNLCSQVFEADAVPSGSEAQTVSLSVRVLDDEHRLFAPPATKDVIVHRTRLDYTVFVLEASTQMSATWFLRARQDLTNKLREIHDRTGEVGIVIFGATSPKDAPGCNNVHTLVDIAPLNLRKVTRKVWSIVRGEAKAPLRTAIGRAQDSLRPLVGEPGVTSRVVDIIGGLDTCFGDSFDDSLEARETSIRQDELENPWRQFRFLPLTIFSDPGGLAFREWRNSKAAQERYRANPFAVLFIDDFRVLSTVVRAAASLGLDEPSERQAACKTLESVFLRQLDKTGAAVVRNHCATVR